MLCYSDLLFSLICFYSHYVVTANLMKKYDPNWDSLDTRPQPEWYDKAKIGIMLHWGVYSVPSFDSEWFWKRSNEPTGETRAFLQRNYPPGFTYQEFAPMFTAEFFDPQEWANLFKRSGAKYVVLTSKHHDGFSLYPSKRPFSWNSVDIGPHRDLVRDLAKAVRDQKLNFGVYYSLYEWFNPLYLEDRNNTFATTKFTEMQVLPDLKQLVNDYEPTLIWSDDGWEATNTYWSSADFLAWLYNESPVRKDVVANDRWGKYTRCKHGDFYTCEEMHQPAVLQSHKWENAFSIDKTSWGYRRNIVVKDILTMKEILKKIVSTISCGGNALINVGPTKEGTISLIFQERLTSLGAWLDINGRGIYGTSPWHAQKDTQNSHVWYTCTKLGYDGRNAVAKPSNTENITAIYAIVLQWPANNLLEVKELTPILQTHDNYKLIMLDSKDISLEWRSVADGLVHIQFPDRALVNSQYAWTIELSFVN